MKFTFLTTFFALTTAVPARVERNELTRTDLELADKFTEMVTTSMSSQVFPTTNNRGDILFEQFREIYLEIMKSRHVGKAVKILRYASQSLNGEWKIPGMPSGFPFPMISLEAIIKQELKLDTTRFVPVEEASDTEIPVLYTANSPTIASYSKCGEIQVDAGNETNVLISSAAIGRVPGVDFFIGNNDKNISRISFIIIAIPRKAVIVMDMGSIGGIETLERQRKDLPRSHSTPTSRK